MACCPDLLYPKLKDPDVTRLLNARHIASHTCSTLSFASLVASSSGVVVLSCKACIPPSLAISSFNKLYIILCRAGCRWPENALAVTISLRLSASSHRYNYHLKWVSLDVLPSIAL